MPNDLRAAHHELDLQVEKLYRAVPFENEMERVAFLFGKYKKIIGENNGN